MLAKSCEPQFGARGGSRAMDMGLLSNLLVTSYRFPIVTIQAYLSTFSQRSDFSRTDRRTERIGLAKGGTILCTEVHRPPKHCYILQMYFKI